MLTGKKVDLLFGPSSGECGELDSRDDQTEVHDASERSGWVEALSRFARDLEGVETSQFAGQVLVVDAEVPRLDPLRFLTVIGDRDLFWWRPAEGVSVLCWDDFETETFSGVSRFSRASAYAQSFFTHARMSKSATCPEPLRAFFGFAFEDSIARDSIWADFGAARVSIPRWQYIMRDGRAWLRVLLGASDEKPFLKRTVARLEEVAQPTSKVTAEPVQAAVWAEVAEEADRTAWLEGVRGVQESVRREDLLKVVLSRASAFHCSGPIDQNRLLGRLLVPEEGTLSFAVRRSGRMFLGRTPERLVRRQGDLLNAEALAGTVQATPESRSTALGLLDSEKDRREHDLVVRFLVDRLKPFCRSMEWPDAPVARSLAHVTHLSTPISGELDGAVDLLDVVGRLHPTPAVGGLPVERAKELIRSTEGRERGWYAAPLGWINADGDGDFWVGLRSGLVAGDSAKIFAGAGIVEGSDASAEFEETRWKQRAFLEALLGGR
jgi:menaquinone-specific isochorismate synthase